MHPPDKQFFLLGSIYAGRIFCDSFGLERRHFTRKRQVVIGVNCEKSSLNITYEALGVLGKNIIVKECANPYQHRSLKGQIPIATGTQKSYRRKDDEYGSRHRNQAKLSHINCLRRLILKFLKKWFFKPPFASLLGPQHKIQTCESLVNICLCAVCIRARIFFRLEWRRFFLPVRQSFADIGSVSIWSSSLLAPAWRVRNFW